MTSRVPELIDALVARCTADEVLTNVTVTDGPEVGGAAADDWLLIGFDGNPEGDFEAAQTVGGWASLLTDREEQLQIPVTAVATRGDTDVRAARERAYQIGARLEELLRADPGVGLPSLEVAIEASQLVQDQTTDGIQARLVLTVAGRAFT
ncbi:hypothetical protein [Streptomyces sp. NPDC088182]|uniref:hypothetical protein n=1 Tax=Streptomyces sp. NPDC088182 TaxID=3365838 RepID=UPI00381BE5A6